MKAFLKLVRYQYLLMLILMQLVFRYGFLKIQNISLALNDWQYFILVLATVAIAAGGFLINAVVDSEASDSDAIVPESTAYNIYVTLNITGVGAGFYLANLIGKTGFSMIFIAVAGILYIYAMSLKKSLLIGNFLIAAITAFAIIIIAIFDLYPIITPENKLMLGTVFKIMLDYALFCFMIIFISGLVQNLEDTNSDYNSGMNTLPIVLGIARTSRLVFTLSFVPLMMVLFYINEYFIANDLFIATFAALFLLAGPLLYFTIKTWTAKTQKDFRHLDNALKLTLLSGILCIFIISLNIRMNA